MTFQEHFNEGRIGETIIASWFKKRGFSVLPVYEIEKHTGKGPRLFLPDKKLIAPDMIVFNSQQIFWIEAKHKTAFAWHRISGGWTTGIDLNHYFDYCEVEELTPFPVWLLFLHKGGKAKDSPDTSPAGLFGNDLKTLQKNEHHRHSNWGKHGMVYWRIESLKKISDYDCKVGLH